MERTLINTATTMTLSGWSATTLSRRVQEGLITSYPDPRDKRRVLYDADEITAIIAPGHTPDGPADLHDLAALRFSRVLAEYEESNLDQFREMIKTTPNNLIPIMFEMAMYLAFNSIEDDVANATPEQREAARAALADEL